MSLAHQNLIRFVCMSSCLLLILTLEIDKSNSDDDYGDNQNRNQTIHFRSPSLDLFNFYPMRCLNLRAMDAFWVGHMCAENVFPDKTPISFEGENQGSCLKR